MQIIELKGLVFHSYHGVMEQERLIGNQYTIDIQLLTDFSKAFESDNLEDTINYAQVYELIKQEMEIPSCLLEHVAGRIINRIKNTFPAIKNIKLRLAKRRPPIEGDIEEAAVVVDMAVN